MALVQMIRKIEAQDIASVAEIYNYYIANTVISFEEEQVSVCDMSDRVEKVAMTSFPWLVAEDNGKMVGYAYANQWKDRSAYKHSAEVTVYLSHLSCSQGWGARLYGALFSELKEMSIHTVIAGIALPNAASIALHEKFSMEKVAHFANIGFKFNEWVDTGYWQVKLS